MEYAHLLEKEEPDPVCGLQKSHRLYPGPEAVEAFQERLAAYFTSKGTIRLPYQEPLPLELIGDIAQWCWEQYSG